MRIREPLLYEQYIAQYLTDDEVRARSRARAVTALVQFRLFLRTRYACE